MGHGTRRGGKLYDDMFQSFGALAINFSPESLRACGGAVGRFRLQPLPSVSGAVSNIVWGATQSGPLVPKKTPALISGVHFEMDSRKLTGGRVDPRTAERGHEVCV